MGKEICFRARYRKVSVLSSEMDQMKVMEPYLPVLYWPFRVKLILGPAGVLEPIELGVAESMKKNTSGATGEAWMSSWLLDCARADKPADCFNILHESDFRLYIQDCYALEKLYDDRGWAFDWSDHDNNMYAGGHPAHDDNWEDPHPDGAPSYFPTWLRMPSGMPKAKAEDISNDWMRKLHCLVTAAHRWKTPARPNGSGDFIVFSWKGCTKGGPTFSRSWRKDKPARWTGMVGCTTACARKILYLLDTSCLPK